MQKTITKKILFLLTLSIFALSSHAALAAKKTGTPRITQAIESNSNINTKTVRIHFEIPKVVNGEMIQVKYNIKGKKFTDLKIKPPKGANRSGTVGAAASARGSAIDIFNLPQNRDKVRFFYNAKVQVKQAGHKWSSWSSIFSF